MLNKTHYLTNVFSQDELDYLLNLTEVQIAKSNIYSKSSGSVYFDVPINYLIKQSIEKNLGLDLSNTNKVPMRWIRGDTPKHKDIGTRSFEKTHLIYLTDSEGELILDNESYPIAKNSAYIFNEGLNHETINTGSEPRLLLGPMSEEILPVGGFTINADGATDIVYIRYNSDTSIKEYKINNNSWNELYLAAFIYNTNPNPTNNILKIIFTTDITLVNTYDHFICSTDGIQFGSESLKNDGTRPIITIDGVVDYPGLIQNGNDINNGYDNIYVFNLDVRAINGSTLYASEGPGSGWVCQQYFGKGASNNYIINCSSDGPINFLCGGIVGPYSGNESGQLTIIGCSSSGIIDFDAGGIIGSNCGSNGNVIIESCWSTGEISDTNAGGITGPNLNNATINNCYSTGNITGENAGGIAGDNCGNVDNVNINNCYSTGNISGFSSGGIVGALANNVNITNCYTTGRVVDSTYSPPGTNNSNGAICGFNNEVNNIIINNCYTSGIVDNNGYFNGKDSNNYSVTINNSFSEAQSGTPGTWNTTNANTVLQGLPNPVVGNTWVATIVGQPYELKNMGYHPYNINNINLTPNPSLKRTLEITLNASDTSDAAIISGKSYSILQKKKSGVVADVSNTITINLTTGVITTSNTQNGTYIIYLRNNGSYHITELTLIIEEEGGSNDCTYKYHLYNFDIRRVRIYERNRKMKNAKNKRRYYTFIKLSTDILDYC